MFKGNAGKPFNADMDIGITFLAAFNFCQVAATGSASAYEYGIVILV